MLTAREPLPHPSGALVEASELPMTLAEPAVPTAMEAALIQADMREHRTRDRDRTRNEQLARMQAELGRH